MALETVGILQKAPYAIEVARRGASEIELYALPALSAEDEDFVHDRLPRFAEVTPGHPQLGTVFQVTSRSGSLWVEQESVGGGSIAAYVAQFGLELSVALKMIGFIARGLAGLHDAGLTHGHLNPWSVRIGRDGSLRLMDLGGPNPRASTTPWMRRFMAPEQEWTAASDMYSLGMLVYGLLTPPELLRDTLGGSPADDGAWVAFHRDPDRRMPDLQPHVPLASAVAETLFALADKRADARPGARDVVRTLTGAPPPPPQETSAILNLAALPRSDALDPTRFMGLDLTGLGDTTLRPRPGAASPVERLGRAPRRLRWMVVAALGVALLAGAIGVAALFSSARPDVRARVEAVRQRDLAPRPVPAAGLPLQLVAAGTNAKGYFRYRHKAYPLHFVYVPADETTGHLVGETELPHAVLRAFADAGQADARDAWKKLDGAQPAAALTARSARALCGFLGDGFHVCSRFERLLAAGAGIYDRVPEWVTDGPGAYAILGPGEGTAGARAAYLVRE